MAKFVDQFSKQADIFKQYRPTYPDELYRFISSLCNERKNAWDCGCGNGQSTLKLADFFDCVVGTDASQAQIANAPDADKINFRVALAEDSGLEESSIDLITVASALHWFNSSKFFKEANRVLKPGGIFAAWSYQEFSSTAEINEAFALIYEDIKGYWSKKLDNLRNKYESLEMPFEEIQAPDLKMSLNWDLYHCMGFLRSWSATQNLIDQKGIDPTEVHFAAISEIWGDPKTRREVTWNLNFKIGRKALSPE